MNPVAQSLTGWREADALGNDLEEVFHIINELTRQEVESPVAKVLRLGTVVGLANHTLLIAKGGREIPIDDSGAPIKGSGGELIGVVLVFRDITERRNLEQVRTQLAAIVESSDDAILSKDVEGTILSWNKGAERLYGYTAEEVIGRPVSMLMPADQADDFPLIMERLKRGERINHFETRRVSKDGRLLEVSLTISPIRDASGKIAGASAVARDISERRQAEAELRGSEEKFFKAFHANPDPMTIHSLADGRYLDANESFLRITGFTKEEVIGRTAADLGLAVQPENLSNWRQALLEKGSLHNREVAFRTKGGEVREGLMSAEVIRIAGEPCVLAVTADITERQRAERERDSLLEREQAARAQAEEASRTKDEFLATVSHELRTPLNAILGWSRLLRSQSLDAATIERAVEVVERNARTQAEIIDDLLDVSRIITGKLGLKLQTVELPIIIREAVETGRPAADIKGIHLQAIIDPDAGPISGDPNRLRQIVWNLLSNAVKFTPKGGQVQIRLACVNSNVELTVSDTGDGISQEFLPYVFDRFRQADSSSTRKYGGLGLGLAIVRHLVELHGGTVEAQSEGPGKGATFVIRLPLAASQDATQHRGEASPSPGFAPRGQNLLDSAPRVDGLRVLIVEDEADSLDLVTEILSECGVTVRAVRSAPEALAALKEFQPDVLVSDIEMPGEDGYALIRKIRALPAHEGGQIPAIALTAYARGEDRLRSLSAGFDAHIGKPMEPMELVTVIASLTRRMGGKGS